MIARSPYRGRRGSLLVEVAMATSLLMIVMTLTVKVTGFVAIERRAAERREWAALEVANLMERITAYDYDQVTPDLASRMTLSPQLRQLLPEPDLAVDVSPLAPGPGRSAKRITIKLRWRGQGGTWAAPVRLTSWVERWRPES